MNRGYALFRRAGLPVLALTTFIFTAEAVAQVEEIVVTTRKREENLQEVPIAITAITAGQVEARGLTELDDVAKTSASLLFTQGFAPQDKNVSIRGLVSRRGRVNTAVLLDGIDITSESIQTVGGGLLIDPNLFDLERIEVVKGPQNALYGRSAFNGAVSYITRKPSESFDASVGTDIGSDGQLRFTGRVSGPLTGDNLFGGLSGMTYSHDGFHRNTVTGDEVGGSDGSSIAGSLLWKATSAITVLGRLSYSDDEYEAQPWAWVNPAVNIPIPQAAIDSGVIPATRPGNGTVIDVDSIIYTDNGQPSQGLPPIMPGHIVGFRGKYPGGDSFAGATMSEDPRTCLDPDDRTTCSDFPGTTREVTRATLNIDWDLGPVLLTSLTSYVSAEFAQAQDSNSIGSSFLLPLLTETRFDNENDLFSQELRLASNTDSTLNWTVGALWWSEKIDQVSDGSTCLAFSAPTYGGVCGPFMSRIRYNPDPNDPLQFDAALGRDQWGRRTQHASAYFLAEWEFVPSWSFALEGRYVTEDLKVIGPGGNPDGTVGPLYPDTIIDPYNLGFNFAFAWQNAECVPNPGVVLFPFGPGFDTSCISPRPSGVTSGTSRDSYFVPKATLKWQAADNQMYYFSVAQARKPKGISALNGGIGAFVPNDQRFDAEERTVYELGAKTSWLDRRVRLDAAVFFDKYDKKLIGTQVIVGEGENALLTTRTTNGGKAEVLGLELELGWDLTEYLSLFAGYTWLDAEWTDFKNVTASPVQIAYGGNCTPVTVQTSGGPASRCIVSYDGNKLENAPEHTLVANVRYQRPLVGVTDWFVEGDTRFQDERYPDFDNLQVYDSYWISNFRAGIENDRWTVVAYVDNAFDDDTIQSALSNIDVRYLSNGSIIPNGARVLLPDPRTYGLRVNYRFGR